MSQLPNEPMRPKRRTQIAVVATFLLILVTLFAPLPLGASAPQARRIEMSARQFAYEPATLTVNRGDTITFHLESLDATHGWFVDGYNVNIQAEPGKSAEVTFVADQAGLFKFRCSIPCGNLHPFMIGELNVEPNEPRARTIAATLVIAMGAMLFFWNRM